MNLTFLDALLESGPESIGWQDILKYYENKEKYIQRKIQKEIECKDNIDKNIKFSNQNYE